MKRLVGMAVGALTLAAAGMAHAAPKPEEGWGYPRDVSVDGHRIDWLLNVTSVFVGILFLIMCVWMAMAMVKHGKNKTAQYDHGNGKKQIVIALAISGLIFFVVDGNLFVNSIIDLSEAFWNFEKAEKHPEAVRIEINAHQWAWDARYPGEDKEFGTKDDIVSLNEIAIPKGVPIIFQLRSVDVIHSFYLPNLRQKTDIVPGNTTYLWFTAKETGDFDIACAQHCGVSHYKMKGLLRILEPEGYQAWHAEAQANAKVAYVADDSGAHWGWPWDKDYY